MNQKQYRVLHNLRIADMAKYLGVTQSSLYRYERGHMLEPSVLLRIYSMTCGDVTPNDYFFEMKGVKALCEQIELNEKDEQHSPEG